MRVFAIAAATLLLQAAWAQQVQTPAGVYHLGAGIKPPTLLYRQQPEFSEEARAARLQGTVTLSLVVGEDGKARDIRVVRSLGLGLDENAVTSVSGWRFAPGTKDGQPVAVVCNVEVDFKLLMDPRDWYPSRVVFSSPPGATQPALMSAPHNQSAALPENASARVSFDIDAQGAPINIHVDQSSDPKWDDEVMAMIREWRFQAALRNGTAIESHGYVDLTRGLAVAAASPRPALLNGVPIQPPMKKRIEQ